MQSGGDEATGAPRPGWYPDPSGRQPVRWFDGDRWTAHVVDGGGQPRLDPLPDHAATPPVAPGTPGVAGTSAPPVERRPPKIPVGSLVVRCLALGIVAVLLVLGFLALPYARVDSWPRDFDYAPVRYLELGAWLRAYDTKMNAWGRAYSQGLGPLIALVVWAAVAGTVLLVSLVPRYRARAPWWTFLVFALAVAAMFSAMVASPGNGTVLVASAAGYPAVLGAHVLLVLSCPLRNRSRGAPRGGRRQDHRPSTPGRDDAD
ncbi:DUF2510 domain-containing protein [Micromonospora costi]|uniref:DUF2510 domain-containing protein n=1 Tax=Micromonospora costi TaxID=1530042 RepID=UPI00340A3320